MKNRYTFQTFARNPEIKKQWLLCTLIGVLAVGCCFFAVPKAAIPAAITWAVMVLFHFVESWKRYRKISQLSDEIDRILHGEDIILLQHMEEGELSILENEVNKMLTRLRDQNRELKKEKGYLADSLADLSHQLRTPLTSMNLVLSMMEQDNLSEEKKREYHRKLISLLSKVQWLIEVMLKISKLDAGAVTFEKQKCPMNILVREAMANIEIPLEIKEIKTAIDIARGASFSGDLKWTTEAVANILKNCMEHTPVGGQIQISGVENAIYSELVISDNGEGIGKEDFPHLMERFYKGKNSSEDSVGIGLALANSIITGQGGSLKAENVTPHGAKFSIRFYKG